MNLVHKSARMLVFQKEERFFVINNNPTYDMVITVILDRVPLPVPSSWHMQRTKNTLHKYYTPPNVDLSMHTIRMIVNQNILDILTKFNDHGKCRFEVFHYNMSKPAQKPHQWKNADEMPELYFVEALI